MRGGTRSPSSNAALARRRLKPKKIWLHTKDTTQGKGHSNVRSVELDLHATVDSGSIKREFTRLHQEEVKQDGQSLGRQMSPRPKLNRYEYNFAWRGDKYKYEYRKCVIIFHSYPLLVTVDCSKGRWSNLAERPETFILTRKQSTWKTASQKLVQPRDLSPRRFKARSVSCLGFRPTFASYQLSFLLPLPCLPNRTSTWQSAEAEGFRAEMSQSVAKNGCHCQ